MNNKRTLARRFRLAIGHTILWFTDEVMRERVIAAEAQRKEAAAQEAAAIERAAIEDAIIRLKFGLML